MKFDLIHNNVDLDRPLLYLWVLKFATYQQRYVGKSLNGAKRPRLHYARNVKNLINGKPYRKSNPDGFRKIHHAMAECVEANGTLTLYLLENVAPLAINNRKRDMVLLYHCDLNG